MLKQQDDQCPAIILGTGETALGTMRSLHRSGIQVAYSEDKANLAAWSKFDMTLDNWPTRALSPVALQEWLESTGLSSAVLMPCSDAWVQSVSQLDEATARRFRRWTPSADLVDTMVDKNLFRSVLEKLDLPHPRSYFLDRDIDAWQIPDEVFTNAFLKPHDSLTFFDEFGVKGIFVSSADDAFRKAQAAWDKGIELLIQEYIPGPPCNHYYVDGYKSKDGSVTQLLARQRLRMYPPDFGNSTIMVTVPLASVQPAIDALNRLFGHTGFHGIFSAEFKLDENDGKFKIVEVNCRPWWYVDYADRCGLQVCNSGYLDALDLRVPTQKPYKIGKLGTYPIYDWEVFQNSDKRSVVSFVVMLFNWLRSYQPIFCWSDPMPAMVNFYRLSLGTIGRRTKQVFRKSGN